MIVSLCLGIVIGYCVCALVEIIRDYRRDRKV